MNTHALRVPIESTALNFEANFACIQIVAGYVSWCEPGPRERSS